MNQEDRNSRATERMFDSNHHPQQLSSKEDRSASQSRSRKTSVTTKEEEEEDVKDSTSSSLNQKDSDKESHINGDGNGKRKPEAPRKDSIKPLAINGGGDLETSNEKMISNDEMTRNEKREKDPVLQIAIHNLEELPEGAAEFRKLSWQRLAVCLLCESVALGTLSMPSAYATLGLVPGLLITCGIALISVLCSYWVGQVKLRYPMVTNYADIGRLMFGRGGFIFTAVMLVALLTLTTASHVVTGSIMFNTLTDHATCSVAWGVISAVLLFLVALPKSFHDMAILAYVDFVSILAAVGVTIIATGVSRADNVDWHVFLPPELRPNLQEAFLSVTNIVFAFAYLQTQPSFSSELRDQTEYMKAISTTVSIECVVYCLTGSLVYVFVGTNVESPALLSASDLISKVAFGLAIPVIFISGGINTTTAARFIWERKFSGTIHEYFLTKKSSWMWIGLGAIITFVAWLVASLIPFFSSLLGIIASLFITSFTFILPGFMYLILLRDGAPASPYLVESETETYHQEEKERLRNSKSYKRSQVFHAIKNSLLATAAVICILIGLTILGLGVWASAEDIKKQFNEGSVGRPFSCN